MEKAEIAIGEENKQNCPPSQSNCPWLLFEHYQGTKEQTFYSLAVNESYVRSIPELVNNKVWNSYHGWLILSKDSRFSLWNPVTLETICLPPLELDYKRCIGSCILSSPPSNPDSTFILLDEGNFAIWFYRLQSLEQCWSKHYYEDEIKVLFDGEDTSHYIYCPACCENKVYCKVSGMRMAVRIDFVEPNSVVLQPVDMPFPRNMITACLDQYLIGSLGELFVVSALYDYNVNGTELVLGILIYKLDLSSMVWERVKSAKDRAFFYSEDDCSNSCSAICTEDIGNRVYFIRSKDKSLYSYHIEDATLAVSLPCPDMTASRFSRTWVMPDTRITSMCGKDLSMTGKEQFEQDQASKESENELEGSEEEMSKLAQKEENESKIKNFFDLPNDVLKNSFTDRLVLHDSSSHESLGTRCKHLSPWLIFTQENVGLCSFVSPNVDRFSFQVPESLSDSRLLCCKDNWLLMGKLLSNDSVSIRFFNPLTKDVIPYPDLDNMLFRLAFSRFAFSSPPTSSNCVVVLVTSHYSEVEISVCRSKEEGWVSYERDCNKDIFFYYTNSVYIDGAFYFLGDNEKDRGIISLGVLRIEGDDCNWEVFEQPEEIPLSFSEHFLAERNGEVFLVLVGTIGKWIRVFKVDRSTKSWKEVEDLGNYTLYISRTSYLFTVATSQDTRNIIYFPRLCGEHLVYYSLNTKSFHSSGTGDTLSNYRGTTETLICGWIVPSWN